MPVGVPMSVVDTTAAPSGEPIAGTAIVRLDLAGTVAFVAAGAAGATLDGLGVGLMIVTSLVLFAIGTATFIWSFFVAAERSRTDELGVAALYLLTGPTAPMPVKRVMVVGLLVQVAASVAFAVIGFSGLADDEVNPMAFGILVPMFGIGLNGLWASRHGRFGPRIVVPPCKVPPAEGRQATSRRGAPASAPDLEKNAQHG